ncbi:MAG: thermonuclease family protein [Sneathiella sp.]|nr:thermonuclease family protein [Sneathiella sp.]
MKSLTLLFIVLFWSTPLSATVNNMVSKNQYWGQVTDVYDGDSLTARISLWPGQFVDAKVRIRGIDAPEIRGNCEFEKQKAIASRDFLRTQVFGNVIRLTNVKLEKYGRILAAVWQQDGSGLAGKMTQSGYARVYKGGKRKSWCE